MGWVILYQLTIKMNPHRHGTGHLGEDNPSLRLSSPVILGVSSLLLKGISMGALVQP